VALRAFATAATLVAHNKNTYISRGATDLQKIATRTRATSCRKRNKKMAELLTCHLTATNEALELPMSSVQGDKHTYDFSAKLFFTYVTITNMPTVPNLQM
jgi:hypothetical protein